MVRSLELVEMTRSIIHAKGQLAPMRRARKRSRVERLRLYPCTHWSGAAPGQCPTRFHTRFAGSVSANLAQGKVSSPTPLACYLKLIFDILLHAPTAVSDKSHWHETPFPTKRYVSILMSCCRCHTRIFLLCNTDCYIANPLYMGS